ncbi:YjzD family protein [Pseudalkalibacillus berkeleyi]|uniref:YjzD family protein n=1 Tax=Pseudalkalibacillus berkeleyi TaxID=1069813 RepID=A0ABS9GVI7_9BACL|nr:YjzD family protein [Pseudalkalibacillus berkeleyi]MCF6136827.1 YjzD family protein [Pseudalkalibacillus berkeleyi]
MRYIWTLIWSFLLSNMAFYVLSSMQGGSYNFALASIIGVVFALFVFVLGDAGIKDETAE